MKNWYDLPAYYDVSFSHKMSEELAFLKGIFNQYCKSPMPKLLEPACGSGRLLAPLTRAGFKCAGFDLNQHALDYLKQKLKRNELSADIFNGDMVNFNTGSNKYDAAFCTVDTFRHLLTEKHAEQHLLQVSKALKKNGLYVLGLHLFTTTTTTTTTTTGLPKAIRWTNKRGRLTVHTSMTMKAINQNKRTETLKVVLKVESANKKESHISIYKLRTYRLKQLIKLLDKTSVFEIINVYDENYDLSYPIKLNAKTEYAVLLLKKK